ncbi:hypothetical protein EON79_06640 [bacterium]|nr:MAG: hypothetical protein EON79_06640 [bacterium]
MMRLASLLALCLPALACADEVAEAAYLRSIRRAFPVNIVAITSQRDPKNERAMQSIRVERDKEGRIHHVVLQPLRLMGIETSDDGVHKRVYWPDQNLLIEEVSALRTKDDAALKLSIAKKNYAFKITGRERIAGRDAIEVVAQPKHGGMDSRRFFLDAKYFYPLRVISVSPSGQETLHLDTQDILFPNTIPLSRFDVKPSGTPRLMQYERQAKMTASLVEERLGFEPILPNQIPLGFRRMPEMLLTASDSWNAVSVRLTDGILRATIYQWKAGKKDKTRVSSIENSSFVEYRGICVLLVSEMAPQLRERLLNGFIERAEAEALLGQFDPFWNVPPTTDR